MTDASFTIAGDSGHRAVQLASYLEAELQERATIDARGWIKQLRHLRVDGTPFRERFTYRDDSLWWFSEIFLHKQRVIDTIFRVRASLERLIDQEQPYSLTLDHGDVVTRMLAPQVAAARRVRYTGPPLTTTQLQRRMLALNSRAAWLHTSALA